MHPRQENFLLTTILTRASQHESIVINLLIHVIQTMTQSAERKTRSLSSHLLQPQQNHPHGILLPSSPPSKWAPRAMGMFL
jgi:hypothetical protein